MGKSDRNQQGMGIRQVGGTRLRAWISTQMGKLKC